MRRRFGTAALVAVGFCAGCQLILGLEDHTPVTVDVGDTGPFDAGHEAEAAAVDATPAPQCFPVYPPGPPAIDDYPNAPPSQHFFAVKRFLVDLDASTPLTSVGYDLDHSCTCVTAPEAGSCVSTKPHCDDDKGIDNSLGALFLNGTFQFATLQLFDKAHTFINDGVRNFLFELIDYNGENNDPDVTLQAFTSDGTIAAAIADAGPDADDGGNLPSQGNGADYWTVDRDSLVDVDNLVSAFRVKGYVADGVLVASGHNGFFGVGDLNVKVVEMTFTGSIKRLVAGAWTIDDAKVSGRIDAHSFLKGLSGIKIESDYVCPGTPYYQLAVPLVCNQRDISADPSLDNAGKDCDALSMSIPFVAVEAKLGTVRTMPSDPSNCTTDDEAYKCPAK